MDANERRRSVYAATRKEVAAKLADALARKDNAPAFKPTNITVRDFLAEYQDAVEHSLKRRSFENARDVIRLHLLSDERYHALYVLGLTTGARWGELSDLFYSDLDLDRPLCTYSVPLYMPMADSRSTPQKRRAASVAWG
jgi:integrase